MAGKESFRDLWTSWNGRNNYAEVYETVLQQFAGNQTEHMREARSCLGFGTGAGDYEIDFIRRFLPCVQTVVAVEQDEESATEFQLNLSRHLPNVEGVVHQTSVQDWSGAGERVDVVLLMRILYHVRQPHRRALFHQLFHTSLSPGGYVIIITHTGPGNSNSTAHFISKLNPDYYIECYDDVKSDMIAAGFQLEQDIEFQSQRDFSNPDDEFLRLQRRLVNNTVSVEKVRETIQEVFPNGKTGQCTHKFAVFQKPFDK